MPKLKTHSGAKKRFKLTKNGKVKFQHTNKRHRLNQMATKRKRQLRVGGLADATPCIRQFSALRCPMQRIEFANAIRCVSQRLFLPRVSS